MYGLQTVGKFKVLRERERERKYRKKKIHTFCERMKRTAENASESPMTRERERL